MIRPCGPDPARACVAQRLARTSAGMSAVDAPGGDWPGALACMCALRATVCRPAWPAPLATRRARTLRPWARGLAACPRMVAVRGRWRSRLPCVLRQRRCRPSHRRCGRPGWPSRRQCGARGPWRRPLRAGSTSRRRAPCRRRRAPLPLPRPPDPRPLWLVLHGPLLRGPSRRRLLSYPPPCVLRLAGLCGARA